MRITILTLFPEMFDGFLNSSIISRAIKKNKVSFDIINIRDFSKLNNSQVDDTPYGGGAGMVMRIEPVVDALKSVKTSESKVFLMGPAGKVFNEKMSYELKKIKHLILICGHYEGIDARIYNYIDGEISIGDYILTGGEIPAMAISDSIIRLLDGVINSSSLESESFNSNLLDYPNYTKPPIFEGYKVPDVLISGDHKKIDEYRIQEKIRITKEKRPDLLEKKA